MPYTPPAQRSPAVSAGSSPALSRSQSYQKEASRTEVKVSSPASPPRPTLPRSTSSSQYLSKSRRGPSLNDNQDLSPVAEKNYTYNGELSNNKYPLDRSKLDIHGSLRQSPPPVNIALIPTGAMISPPDSSHNSSDDEENHRGRSRELPNLAELQAAIRDIEQRKESSPSRGEDSVRQALGLHIPQNNGALKTSFSADDIVTQGGRPPLSKEARKISHSRSSTDSQILIDASQVQSPAQLTQDSDDSDDSDLRVKPPMVRKKSGELVRPALRPSSAKRRPSSMPGTPTYSKAVHFDSHLEHVRHFLQVDKPLAVSAGSSPNESYEHDIEFPFGNEGSTRRGPSFEWEIKLSNFPANLEDRKHLPVRLERVFLSADNKNLIGQVAVQNLAFNKSVVARFTLDYWKTTSEVSAEYNNDVRRKQVNDGCDRFNFTIHLTDIGNLESKTMFFCVRYQVNNQEFWDNNNSINYQIDFTKKAKTQPQSAVHHSGAPLSGLPRSRPSPPTSNGQPKKPKPSFDDFSSGLDSALDFDHAPDALIGDPQLKLRKPRARAQVVTDAPARRPKAASGQAFGNRYDFGASLNAAIQNASAILGDESGLSSTKQGAMRDMPRRVIVTPPSETNGTDELHQKVESKPDTFMSQKPSHQSQSYQELVDKYCFVGSRKTSAEATPANIKC